MMNRESEVEKLAKEPRFWDVVIIGGGATGLGCAVESAARGYETLLLEQHDFSKGTSSRSTKLVHGGVRYLQQGNIALVIEALQERGLLIQNAPHLVRNLSFIVPSYEWWNGPFYGVGLKVYDLLAGKLGLGPSRVLSRAETLNRMPMLEPDGLRGGVIYYDAQFDDSRLAVNLAQTVFDLGGVALNYMEVTGFTYAGDMIDGVEVVDHLGGKRFQLNARVVVNATGVFTDRILKMDDPASPTLIDPSQGVHLVLDKKFLRSDSAIMVPHTEDGRVLFAVPWHNRVVVGTTDTPVDTADIEPSAQDEEIEFILTHAAKYLTHDPTREDVLSVFAGLRPLVNPSGEGSTAEVSRDHYLAVSSSGLVTITGGKWTTYRKMGEDTINQAASIAGLEDRPSTTRNLRIHGWLKQYDPADPLQYYGSDAPAVRRLMEEDARFAELLHPDLPYVMAEVVWATRHEMARRVEDVLARRTRALLLDAAASLEAAPGVAACMAEELNKGGEWCDVEVDRYEALARRYRLS